MNEPSHNDESSPSSDTWLVAPLIGRMLVTPHCKIFGHVFKRCAVGNAGHIHTRASSWECTGFLSVDWQP